MVPSLEALARKSGEVEELLGKVDGLELFIKTDFQCHLNRVATQVCLCILCCFHTPDNPIPCPRGTGGHDVECKGCVAGVNLFTTLDALVVHAKARVCRSPP